jgi:hypothetical protein
MTTAWPIRSLTWCSRRVPDHPWRRSTTGLAAGVSNHGTRRLYQRLGYHDWGHGLVPSHWDETDPAGTVLTTNADPRAPQARPRTGHARCLLTSAPWRATTIKTVYSPGHSTVRTAVNPS